MYFKNQTPQSKGIDVTSNNYLDPFKHFSNRINELDNRNTSPKKMELLN